MLQATESGFVILRSEATKDLPLREQILRFAQDDT